MLNNIITESVINTEDYINNKRELKIDLMKMALVLGMILSHSLDFFIVSNSFSSVICNYMNLVCFPGFLFVFGYNSYNAYIKEEKSNINRKIIKNIIILIICYYISGITYIYLVNKNKNILDYVKVLCFLKLPGYSEFLLTFALINVFILFFRKPLKKICEKKIYLIICIIITVLFIFQEPINQEIPYIYLILKTNVMSFPLLPYLNLLFIGMYFAKNNPKFHKEICIILYGMLCYYVIMSTKHLVSRFPVNIAYISGSYIFIYLYYYIFKYIENKYKNKIGLAYLAFIRKKQLTISNI